MGSHKNEFNAGFNPESQINPVPIVLPTLVSMLIDGTSVENKGFDEGALTASQIIKYNFRKERVFLTATWLSHGQLWAILKGQPH